MTATAHWVHDIDPVAIHIYGDFAIRWYGVAYLLAFVIAMWLLNRYHKRGLSPLNVDQQITAMFWLILGVIVGGRLGHMFLYAFPQWMHDPLLVFRVWEGGMASHGGFVGVIVACWWLSKKLPIGFLQLGDILVTLTPPGLMLGRIANFINGELWGTPSNVPWAVIFPNSAPLGTPVAMITPRHPSQLYEAALEGLFLLIYTQWRFRKTNVRFNPGRLSGEFILLYAVVRIIGEQFREPDAALILGMNRGIFYSLFMVVLGAYLIIKSRNTAPETLD